MWGNRLGWAISALILLAYIGGFAWLMRGMNTASGSTDFVSSGPATTPIALPVPPAAALPMPEPADAAPLYRQAIDHYRQHQSAYEKFLTGAPGTAAALPPSDVKGVDLLIEATPMATLTLFAQAPENSIAYGKNPDLEALGRLGDAAIRLALLRQNGDQRQKQQAVDYYQAAFSLGAKLFDERLTYDELMLGLRLMGEAGIQLAKLTRSMGDSARAQAFADFNTARQSYFQAQIQPMARVLRSIDGEVVRRHAGDVLHLAQHAPERLWRVEAILALGRMRFFAGAGGRAGDQRTAERLLKQLASDGDPVIRTAAETALELTLEQYRMLS